MNLQMLRLHHFRNYETMDLSFQTNVNIFVGQNAQGKTNLLEAIHVLALTKSHRTNKDKELIAWQQRQTVLHAAMDKKYGPCTLDLSISHQGKKAKLNGLEQRKLSNYVGHLNVVMFAPEDLEIVKGAPGIRRRFMDMEIAQIEPNYLHHLLQYQKVLTQRNHYLKQTHKSHNHDMLEIWNEQLAQNGSKIIKKRKNFIDKLQKWAETIHSGITNGQEMLTIRYMPSFESEALQDEAMLFHHFMIKLTEVKEQEWRRGVTLVGPHRDDLMFFINGVEAQSFGSQGQQRTVALSLKLAEIELICEEVGEYPLLLLDDVLSELDQQRQSELIKLFQNKVQTFITTTGVESLQIDAFAQASLFHVHQGKVTMADTKG